MSYEDDYSELIGATGANVPGDLVRLIFAAGRGQAELDRQGEGARVEQRIKRLARQDQSRNLWMHNDAEDGPEALDDDYYDEFTDDGSSHDLSGLNQGPYQ